MQIVLIAFFCGQCLCKAPAWPRFSWDTVPVFYHSCNFTGTYNDDALKIVSKFPLVTIEKGQQVREPGVAETKIVNVLKKVKELDSNISTIFYYNSVLDWPFYQLHQNFLEHPKWWMKNKTGGVCRMNGDGSFPNHTNMLVFDFAQEEVRDFWMSECINMTKTGYVDGCFSDRAIGTPCGGSSAYTDGHLKVHQDLQKALKNGVLIANHGYSMPGVNAVHIEAFKADENSINVLKKCVANGKIVQAHAGYGDDGEDHCVNITNSLAAFLIGAGERSYYGCSRHWDEKSPKLTVWHPDYEKPLGFPTGPAVKTDTIYKRSFKNKKGTTTVTFDTKVNKGKIEWAS